MLVRILLGLTVLLVVPVDDVQSTGKNFNSISNAKPETSKLDQALNVAALGKPRFIDTCIIRIGGNPLAADEAQKLARHSIIFANKMHYADINGNSWRAIKSINPNSEIYLYTVFHLTIPDQDSYPTLHLNSLARYNESRSHSMGSLNGDHPEFFLKNSNGQRTRDADGYLLDIGNADFARYTLEATLTDHINHPWSADGIYSDGVSITIAAINGLPAKYPTAELWSSSLNSFLQTMAKGIHEKGTKISGNRGTTRFPLGLKAWIDLDNSAHHLDAALEEGSFAVNWGTGATQFFNESEWRNQVDAMYFSKNTKVCYHSHTDLIPGATGLDNYNRNHTFWDAFYYSLASFLLAKNDTDKTSFFSFRRGGTTYNTSSNDYYDEYERIDLGSAAGKYQIMNINGNNLYWREFSKGYAFVNPTANPVTAIPLPKPSRLLKHSNIKKDPISLPVISSLNLDRNRGAILLKARTNPGADVASRDENRR